MSGISRRGFLITLWQGAVALTLGSALSQLELDVVMAEGNTPPPLTGLPILVTKDTPMLMEHIYAGGTRYSSPEGQRKEWIITDKMPLDFIPEKRPNLEYRINDVPGVDEIYPADFLNENSDLIPWMVDLPHFTGLTPVIVKAVVGFGNEKKMKYHAVDRVETKPTDIVATHAFTDYHRIYPSKFFNIMMGMYSILEWQKNHGPFVPRDEPYSLLEMTGTPERNVDEYLIGGTLDAGGICALATTTSKTCYIASHLGLLEVNRNKRWRTLHEEKIQYAENPFDPGITKANSDATIAWVRGYPADHLYNGDYKFRVTENSDPLYFSYEVKMRHDAEPVPNHSARHGISVRDARIMFTVALQKTNPLEQNPHKMEEILDIIQKYVDFHNFDDPYKGGFNYSSPGIPPYNGMFKK